MMENNMKLRVAKQIYARNYFGGKHVVIFFKKIYIYGSMGMTLIKTGRQNTNQWLGGKKHINEFVR